MKFKIKHLKNLLIRLFTFDTYYVCEECHKIHKRDGKEVRLEVGSGKLLCNRWWYGSVSSECYNKMWHQLRTRIRNDL